MTYAVVTPSRGLVHSRTIEAVMANVLEVPGFLGWFLSHDLPIPDCDERVAELGMATGADAIWFIEEDTIPPAGALAASIALLSEFDVAAVDYPVGSAHDAWGCAVSNAEEVLWCGLGATLIARHVLERLPRPWFSTDYQFVRQGGSTEWKPQPHPQPPDRRWGQQDIYFAMNLRAAGMRIGLVPGLTAAQARVVELGKPGTNHGWHTVAIQDRIERQYPG